MSNVLLSARKLCAFYGVTRVLHGIDFDVEQGGVTALLGANGAGKTSTLRALSGMIRTTGEVTFAGARVDGSATENLARLGIAHVPEGRGTFARMTVAENLQLGAMARRDTANIAGDIERAYGYFPKLRERAGQQAGTLSGGEQQMLAVARGLMMRPRLMLLDEPSFGLAPLIVRDLFGILGKINREDKVSILVVEQNAQLALEIADKAYVIETGRIVMSGSASEIANDESVRKSYLGY
jgi:branched-chain amino acid transport system ATP-binding protein